MLGEVLEAQTSRPAFELVESVRTDAIGYRHGDVDSHESIRRTLSDLRGGESSVVARAFATYFQLVNVAEERERVRAVREREAAGTLGDSIPAAVDWLAEAGADAETVESVLEDVLVEPTFTGHPTEARRKTVKAKLRSVSRHLEDLDTRRLSAAGEHDLERRLEAEVTSLWQTPQVRDRRPEPTDEALNVQWYLENTLFDVVGDVYARLERALDERYDEPVEVPKLFEFRSWAGSDQDGNPYVTPETTAEAACTEYRDLLESEGFVRYFEEATPITVIEDRNLGSRPASRSGERTVEDLRAIPWVFSLTQARCLLPGSYSLGAGLRAYLEGAAALETLREMYEEWPFSRTTLDNAALALARTDLEIAAEYADVADPDLRDRFFPRLREEYERTVELVLDVTGRESLVSREWFTENMERPSPYVDPLNLLQARLLGQSHLTETEQRTLRLTVKGIAAGMKNTG